MQIMSKKQCESPGASTLPEKPETANGASLENASSMPTKHEHAGSVPAKPRLTVKKPRNWDTAVSAAYFRLIGASQKAAAEAANVDVGTLRKWSYSEWWPDAQQEAENRWVTDITAETRKGLMRGLKDKDEYGKMSRWAGDRLIPQLAPPTVRQEVSGPGGGAIRINLEEKRRIIDAILADPEKSRLMDAASDMLQGILKKGEEDD